MLPIDLKQHPEYLDQYLELRNRYLDLLLTEKVSLEDTRQWLCREDTEVVGLVENDCLAGAAILYVSRQGEIACFASEPGCGVGPPLLERIENVAVVRGLASVWAWVRQDNSPARRAFEKCGYVCSGISARDYKGERLYGILYAKKLPGAQSVEPVAHPE